MEYNFQYICFTGKDKYDGLIIHQLSVGIFNTGIIETIQSDKSKNSNETNMGFIELLDEELHEGYIQYIIKSNEKPDILYKFFK